MNIHCHGYRAYGLLIRSDLELPFCAAAAGSTPQRPDLRVRLGRVPDALPVASSRLGLWEAAPGNFLLRVPGTGAFQVTDGAEIVVDVENGMNDAVVTCLTGSVLGACLHQRGIVPLHASAVATPEGDAILFAGRVGMGKSTLLAALVERGYAMIADDVTGIVLGADGWPVSLSGYPTVRLWADTMDKMGWERTAAPRDVREGRDKHKVPIRRFCNADAPLRGVFLLESHNRESIEIEPVAPASAFAPLARNTYRGRLVAAFGREREHFRVIAATANHAWVRKVTRPLAPFVLDDLADRIEEHLDAAPMPARAG